MRYLFIHQLLFLYIWCNVKQSKDDASCLWWVIFFPYLHESTVKLNVNLIQDFFLLRCPCYMGSKQAKKKKKQNKKDVDMLLLASHWLEHKSHLCHMTCEGKKNNNQKCEVWAKREWILVFPSVSSHPMCSCQGQIVSPFSNVHYPILTTILFLLFCLFHLLCYP